MLATAHSKLTAFRRDGGVYPAITAIQSFGTGAQR